MATPNERILPTADELGAPDAPASLPAPAPAPALVAAPDASRPRGATGSRLPVVAGLAAVALLAFVVSLGWRGGWLFGTGEPEGLVFVIPAGAKASVAQPTIDSAIEIPTRIVFAAGEPPVITVRNLDDVAHRAGPFLVEAGQTYVQRFPDPGEYPIACSVNPLESVVVTVEA